MLGQLLDFVFQVACQLTEEAKNSYDSGYVNAVDHIHNRLLLVEKPHSTFPHQIIEKHSIDHLQILLLAGESEY